MSINRIHIRYEDSLSTRDKPFACGIMLASLKAETTNALWEPTQLDAQETTIHKVRRQRHAGVPSTYTQPAEHAGAIWANEQLPL